MTDENFLESEAVNDIIDELATEDKIREAIKVECDRQHVGEDRQEMLYEMYHILHAAVDKSILSGGFLRHIAGFIEPDNGGVYRTTPVSFKGVVGGVPPESIERAMMMWLNNFNEMMNGRIEGYSWAFNEANLEAVIKEFLDIHPFRDGNGRAAWLLRVWMLNQWDNPQPLPDYYKEV